MIFLCISKSYSQQYVTWNPVQTGTQISGSVIIGGQTINVDGIQLAGVNGNNPIEFNSPGDTQNLVVSETNQVFGTFGPNNDGNSRDLVFNFSQPVYVTRYNMHDIDRQNWWNDSFFFNGINFTNNPAPNGINTNVFLGGAQATMENFNSPASWFCSDSPVSSFRINYQTTGGLTHAYLGYSMQVLLSPSINDTNTICLSSTPPLFPVVGNNIVGTWSPSFINTNTIGDLTYTFTPNAGQPIQCPISMTVTVVDCCLPNAILSSPNEDVTNLSPFVFLTNPLAVRHLERSDFIIASNIIGIGDNVFQNGVVYHAENFVELTPGFEALFGSQFAAYPQGCSEDFTYRNTKPIEKEVIAENEAFVNLTKPSILKLYSQNDILKISLIDMYANNLTIVSLDGKTLHQDNSNEKDYYEIDISNYAKGVYIVSTVIGNGQIYSEKFIKK